MPKSFEIQCGFVKEDEYFFYNFENYILLKYYLFIFVHTHFLFCCFHFVFIPVFDLGSRFA